MSDNLSVSHNDYNKVGRVYQNQDGNDFLVSYNQDGMCSLNVDGMLSYYETYGNEFTIGLLSSGYEIAGTITDYINNGG